jgi:oligopeptide/dipeptide ABC transporter ATP-binding protein
VTPLLEVSGLRVALGRTTLVAEVDLAVARGEAVGLVGESGSGKSITAYAIMGLFPAPGIAITGGSIRLDGQELRGLSAAALRAVRGGRIGMVFQDPSSFLDPLMPVGRQVAEVAAAHGDKAPRARAAELLALMELPDPATLARRYPHELSGGMRQRVMIAAALAARPALLIADEPTTALDVTVQAGILALLDRLRDALGLGVLLITHDMGVVAQHCQRVAVMYAGRVVETGGVASIFAAPIHPYTSGLLRSTRSVASGELFAIPGTVAPAASELPGCRFHPRCPIMRDDPCAIVVPRPMPRPGGGTHACLRPDVDAWAGDPWAGT